MLGYVHTFLRFKGGVLMLERLFSLFWSVLDGLIPLEFFVALIAVGFLFGVCSLIRFIFVGDK